MTDQVRARRRSPYRSAEGAGRSRICRFARSRRSSRRCSTSISKPAAPRCRANRSRALSEAQLDRLAEATWRAVSFVDPELSFADFLDLPFSVGELIQAFPSVARGGRPSPGQNRGPTFACACDAGGVARRGKVDFDALIAQVVSNTGWSWDQALDQLTMPRFLALQAEWRRNPPDPLARGRRAQVSRAKRRRAAAPADGRGTEGGIPERRALRARA